MSNDLQKMFKHTKTLEPSPNLEKLILAKIASRQKFVLKRKLAMIYAGFLAASGIFVWAILTLGKAFVQSDFWTLAKLLFSDTSLIIENLNNFAFSLMETLPIFGIIAMLVPVFILFMLASEYFKIVNHNHKFA